MKMYFVAILILGMFLVFGCIEPPAKEYVCPDGSVVGAPEECPGSTINQTENSVTNDIADISSGIGDAKTDINDLSDEWN